MTRMATKYNDALTDAMILEADFDSFMLAKDLHRAQECLNELTAITSKWIPNIIGLKQVLAERGYTHSIAGLEGYLEQFDELNTNVIARADYLLHYLGAK